MQSATDTTWQIKDIRPLRVLAFLALSGLALATISLVLNSAVRYGGVDNLYLGFASRIFDVERESSIPTWFSSTQLAFAAVLLFACSVADRESRFTWRGLFVVFALLSVDEIAKLHERIGGHIASTHLTGLSDGLGFPWVVVGIPFAAAIFALSLRLLMRLPRDISLKMIASGFIFVAGAVGVETFNGLNLDEAATTPSFRYTAGTALEELFEMLGISLFIYTLLIVMKSKSHGSFGSSTAANG